MAVQLAALLLPGAILCTFLPVMKVCGAPHIRCAAGRPALLRARAAARMEERIPPSLPEGEKFRKGLLSGGGFWRQTARLLQIAVPMPEGASFKRDVQIELRNGEISLRVAGASIAQGPLQHSVRAELSEWYVEEELAGAPAGTRYFVVDLVKASPHVDWSSPLGGGGGEEARLVIGGVGEAQKKATAQQLATYQALRKLPATSLADVYARPISPPAENATLCYFIGKVAGDHFVDGAAALSAQEVLVKQHARLLLPYVFDGLEDEAIDLWLAPGNSEVRVAQNEITLSRWALLPKPAKLPGVAMCGFEPETHAPGEVPFVARRDASGAPLTGPFQANIQPPGRLSEFLDPPPTV
ncbi:hypothetical protein AB1Y20_021756 [Prymnesium parvum]|uniref:CS domain-containing protein n=1 Tax=Prymnesium parvum TaxID=97485 RepID=A0AB34JN35_PRYPA